MKHCIQTQGAGGCSSLMQKSERTSLSDPPTPAEAAFIETKNTSHPDEIKHSATADVALTNCQKMPKVCCRCITG